MRNSFCETCNKLGRYIKVDYLEGEKFPPEYKKLIMLQGTDNSILRCPTCGQAYLFSNDYDNDVYNLYNYGTLQQIDENRVQEIIAYNIKREEEEKKEIKKFWYKTRKKFGAKLEALSKDETRVIEYLKEKRIYGEYLNKIAEDLTLRRETMMDITDNLDKDGLIYKQIYYPLMPGKHNFQEEIRDVDTYMYTKISINI